MIRAIKAIFPEERKGKKRRPWEAGGGATTKWTRRVFLPSAKISLVEEEEEESAQGRRKNESDAPSRQRQCITYTRLARKRAKGGEGAIFYTPIPTPLPHAPPSLTPPRVRLPPLADRPYQSLFSPPPPPLTPPPRARGLSDSLRLSRSLVTTAAAVAAPYRNFCHSGRDTTRIGGRQTGDAGNRDSPPRPFPLPLGSVEFDAIPESPRGGVVVVGAKIRTTSDAVVESGRSAPPPTSAALPIRDAPDAVVGAAEAEAVFIFAVVAEWSRGW